MFTISEYRRNDSTYCVFASLWTASKCSGILLYLHDEEVTERKVIGSSMLYLLILGRICQLNLSGVEHSRALNMSDKGLLEKLAC